MSCNCHQGNRSRIRPTVSPRCEWVGVHCPYIDTKYQAGSSRCLIGDSIEFILLMSAEKLGGANGASITSKTPNSWPFGHGQRPISVISFFSGIRSSPGDKPSIPRCQRFTGPAACDACLAGNRLYPAQIGGSRPRVCATVRIERRMGTGWTEANSRRKNCSSDHFRTSICKLNAYFRSA